LEVKHGVTLVPAEAIGSELQGPYVRGPFVWLINPDQTVTGRPVGVGTTDGTITEIESGLSPGDLVATGPSLNLEEGQKIRYKLVHNKAATPADLPGAKVQAIVHIRSFMSYLPSVRYDVELPAGYSLRGTASEGRVNTMISKMPPMMGDYYTSWSDVLVPKPMQPGQRQRTAQELMSNAIAWPKQRAAQQAGLQAQFQELQDQGPIPVVLGEPKLVFSITNGAGELYQGFLELVGAAGPASTITPAAPQATRPADVREASSRPAEQAANQNTTKTFDWLQIQPLEGWVSDLQSSDPKAQKMAQRALTEMGTNALPGILKFLNESTEQSGEADSRRLNMAQALGFMGPGVESSLPAFTALLKSGQQEKAYSGARALAFSAPMAPEAFSILTNGLTDSAPGVRDAASHGLLFCLTFESNSFAMPALSMLVRNLKDPFDYVRSDTAVALMSFTQRQCQRNLPEPDFLIQPLIGLLHDKYSFARYYAMIALDCSCFGDKLKPWLPDIQKLLGDPDESVKREAADLLQRLK
jgi:HEAT repeat protein